VKLRRLEEWTEARRGHARLYDELLGDRFQVSDELPGNRHTYHVYAVRVSGRESVQSKLHASGIETGIHYPIPIHLQPAWEDLGYGPGEFPVSELAADQVLSLPMYPELTRGAIAEVAGRLTEAAAGSLPLADPLAGRVGRGALSGSESRKRLSARSARRPVQARG
jgi:dTDP-4-amino-4,6-dideoxygalactose transaminase